jgi:hypothetical protein
MSNSTSRFISNTILKGQQVPGTVSVQQPTNQLSQLKYLQDVRPVGIPVKSGTNTAPIMTNVTSQLKIEPINMKQL